MENILLLELFQCWELKDELPKYAQFCGKSKLYHETEYLGRKQWWVRLRRHRIICVDYGDVSKNTQDYYRRLLLCWTCYRNENELVPENLMKKHGQEAFGIYCVQKGLIRDKYYFSHLLRN
eukprot:826983_1